MADRIEPAHDVMLVTMSLVERVDCFDAADGSMVGVVFHLVDGTQIPMLGVPPSRIDAIADALRRSGERAAAISARVVRQ